MKSEKRIKEADAVHSSWFYSLAKYPLKQPINYEDCIYMKCFLPEFKEIPSESGAECSQQLTVALQSS